MTASFAMAVNPATTMLKNLNLAHLKSYLQGLVRDITLKTQVYCFTELTNGLSTEDLQAKGYK